MLLACGSGLVSSEYSWSADLYGDDGETTRCKTHGEHWRARAGFRSCSDQEEEAYGGDRSTLGLHFEVSHASYSSTTKHENVKWMVTLHLSDAPKGGVSCDGTDGLDEGGWSQMLHVTALSVAGHSCVVLLL